MPLVTSLTEKKFPIEFRKNVAESRILSHCGPYLSTVWPWFLVWTLPCNRLILKEKLAPPGPHYSLLYKHSFCACKRPQLWPLLCIEYAYGWSTTLTAPANPLILKDISGSLRSLIGPTTSIDSSACSNSTVVECVPCVSLIKKYSITPLQLNSNYYDFNMLIKKSNKNKRLALAS